ncbi:MAG: AarF/ABC1/UbiB kinase family protein [Deltaproteobacteria bacterium]|nr:AarF/ABC1/UbiB kinase family protein [Deltaproteobacteria bacterium]
MAAADQTPGNDETRSSPASERAPRVRTLAGLGGSPSEPSPRFSAAGQRHKSYRPDALKRRRFLKAYYVTFVVIASYLWLKAKAKLLGTTYGDREIAEVHQRNAKRIERALLELQGLFIKVGQMLSILAGFLPAEFRDELEGMQDQVPPRPFEEIEARIVKELGKRPDEVFASFNRTPLASASLGQVHEALTHEGRRVAVKVQHHGIEEVVRLDLHTIRQIMRIVQWFVPVQGLDNYYREIRQLLLEELDFAREAQNIARIRANFSPGVPRHGDVESHVETPEVIAELSTSRVLTLTFVEGVKVGAVDELDRLKIDRKLLAKQIVHAFCQMIFVDGVYHADPHPGNLLVQKQADGTARLILIDFGAMAELSQPMREGIPEFLEGVLRRDTDRLIKAMRKMGFLSYGSDQAVVEKVIDHFHRKFQDEVRIESLNLKDIKIDPQKGFENLMDLRSMNVGLKELSSSIHVPRDWVLLERTLLLLTGTCTLLDPDMNPMQIVRPYLERFVLGNRDWTQIAIEAVRDTALKAVGLPEAIDNYIKRALRGELEIKVRGVREGLDGIYALGRQAMYLAAAMTFGGAALWLDVQHGRTDLAKALLWPAGLFAFLFLLLSLTERPRRR